MDAVRPLESPDPVGISEESRCHRKARMAKLLEAMVQQWTRGALATSYRDPSEGSRRAWSTEVTSESLKLKFNDVFNYK